MSLWAISLALSTCLSFITTNALPVNLLPRQNDLRVLSTDEFESTFLRPALFSRLAYCEPSNIQALDCGGPCEPIAADVEILKVGGDGEEIPRYVIAHDRKDNSIVISHQGTDSQSILSIINNFKISKEALDPKLFPKFTDSKARVHEGFKDSFEKTAGEILSITKDALASKNVTALFLTGHSLGGAIAIMDGMMFKDNLDPSIQVKVRTFGTPRSGNQEWADLVDSELGDSQVYLTNKDDVVPLLPPHRILGFQHSGGEIHINGDTTNDIVACPGQENDDVKCSKGDNGDGGLFGIFPDINIENHRGPYLQDISFGGGFCPPV